MTYAGNRYLFLPKDADAVYDFLRRGGFQMQFDFVSRRVAAAYTPTVNHPRFFPPERLPLSGGAGLGQVGKNYGTVVAAGEAAVAREIMQRAKKAPILLMVAGSAETLLQDWRALEMYLRELWHAAHARHISAADLDTAIAALSGNRLATVQDAVADIAAPAPSFFTTREINKGFADKLAASPGIPSYEPLLPRMADYSDRRVGDVVAIGAVDTSLNVDLLTNLGLENHDYPWGIPGVHLGDTYPVSLFALLGSDLPGSPVPLYRTDGTLDRQAVRAMLHALITNKPLLEPDRAFLQRLAIHG